MLVADDIRWWAKFELDPNLTPREDDPDERIARLALAQKDESGGESAFATEAAGVALWDEIVHSLTTATGLVGHTLLHLRTTIAAVEASPQADHLSAQVWEELACAAELVASALHSLAAIAARAKAEMPEDREPVDASEDVLDSELNSQLESTADANDDESSSSETARSNASESASSKESARSDGSARADSEGSLGQPSARSAMSSEDGGAGSSEDDTSYSPRRDRNPARDEDVAPRARNTKDRPPSARAPPSARSHRPDRMDQTQWTWPDLFSGSPAAAPGRSPAGRSPFHAR